MFIGYKLTNRTLYIYIYNIYIYIYIFFFFFFFFFFWGGGGGYHLTLKSVLMTESTIKVILLSGHPTMPGARITVFPNTELVPTVATKKCSTFQL